MPTQAKNIAMTKPVIMWAVKVGGVILGVAHKEDDANEIRFSIFEQRTFDKG